MSVRENIAFGRKDASDLEVIEAASRAQADEFIVEMQNGYDAEIGERGKTLSGGQRQRLAIARALIQDPKILLLDDSVSAVDAQTEFLMRKALDEVMVGRTSITVTQRLRTLLESDMVIIVDKGQLIAAGSQKIHSKARGVALGAGRQSGDRPRRRGRHESNRLEAWGF